jgi:hypothetical protein
MLQSLEAASARRHLVLTGQSSQPKSAQVSPSQTKSDQVRPSQTKSDHPLGIIYASLPPGFCKLYQANQKRLYWKFPLDSAFFANFSPFCTKFWIGLCFSTQWGTMFHNTRTKPFFAHFSNFSIPSFFLLLTELFNVTFLRGIAIEI